MAGWPSVGNEGIMHNMVMLKNFPSFPTKGPPDKYGIFFWWNLDARTSEEFVSAHFFKSSDMGSSKWNRWALKILNPRSGVFANWDTRINFGKVFWFRRKPCHLHVFFWAGGGGQNFERNPILDAQFPFESIKFRVSCFCRWSTGTSPRYPFIRSWIHSQQWSFGNWKWSFGRLFQTFSRGHFQVPAFVFGEVHIYTLYRVYIYIYIHV